MKRDSVKRKVKRFKVQILRSEVLRTKPSSAMQITVIMSIKNRNETIQMYFNSEW